MNTTELAPGAVVDGRYVLERRLGVGGFGAVWLAHDRHAKTLDHAVALKILHPRFLEGTTLARQRFELEAEVLARLDHPNIVRPLAFHVGGEHAYLAMEHVEGVPLDRVLKECARREEHLESAEVARIFDELCAAVHYAHGEGIVHRDLKPSNVMIVRRGGRAYVKVLDLGIAKILGPTARDATTVGRIVGSLFYASPEQIRGEPATTASDVFALGVLAYELVTLRRAFVVDPRGGPASAAEPPFRAPENAPPNVVERITRGPRPKPSDVREGIALELDAIVERALAIDPAARFATAAELAAAAVPSMKSVETTRGTTVFALGPELTPAEAEPRLEGAVATVARIPSATTSTPRDTLIVPRDRERASTVPRGDVVVQPVPLARSPLVLSIFALGAAFATAWAVLREPPATPSAASTADAAVRAEVARVEAPAVRASAIRVEPTTTATRSQTPPGPEGVKRPTGLASGARGAPRPSADGSRDLARRAPDDPGLAELARLLSRAREAPDAARIAALADAIRAQAKRLPEGPVRTRIERRAEANLADADVDGLADCVRALDAALR
ncbi:protein kinase [Myxococcota bacterium]|nr:protein kinase [Myxococcota bacterium]